MRAETRFAPALPTAVPPAAIRGAGGAGAQAGLSLALLAPEALAPAEQARWARLSARSFGGNVFALDWFTGAALAHCRPRFPQVRLAAVRQADGEWLGALPIAWGARIGRAPIPHWQGWRATNQFLGGPLVAAGAERTFWQVLLGALDVRPGAGLALVCEGLAMDDPATLALLSAAAGDGRRVWIPHRHERPARHARSAAQAAADKVSPALRKARARLASLERRLAREMGEVRIERHPAEADPGDWIARFLALERAGWKGRGGSALACEPCNAALFRDAVREGHRLGLARLASLSAGGQVLAMTTWFVSGGQAFGFKMAHDETARRHAPGRLLMRAVAEELESDPGLPFDTCNGEGSAPDPFWPDRREVIDCVVAIGSPARRKTLAGAMAAAALWRELARS
ncbi:GNAT family N-acetyltransferase [Erythrobacter sp. HL-111]|uniref:GNAT family N-acetyltransferase n=1 Tax=Erythrobacter sp. HL-111 TaxID=1798193 RepID=UPI0006DAF1F6|nr:GNAT family N-acetyltransferase [Erythrobacter sp. HL-111]KPP92882.1 MAG: Protein involved in cellulose biosynthesis (CelD) [Erythrobacteraceae bacterium HL-111]SDT00072.1 Acetyltransferase involved in cellulose biosynthesis, CelD/BcsL family [Erythrobacter sp. HL-111]